MAHFRPSSEIAKEIRRLRGELGLSQTAFAKTLGTSQSRLGAWERASDDYTFDPESLEKIATAANVPLSLFHAEQPGRVLSTPEVVRLRDQLHSIRERTTEALKLLDTALGKESIRTPRRAIPSSGPRKRPGTDEDESGVA